MTDIEVPDRTRWPGAGDLAEQLVAPYPAHRL